jgi:hypothetical protein
MSLTVFLNEVRADSEETDRLVTYQPPGGPSKGIPDCIGRVVAIKGLQKPTTTTTTTRREYR